MRKIISFIIALFQFFSATLGFVPHNPDIDYGGTYRPIQYTTNLQNIIEDGKTDYSIIISENAKPVEKTAAEELSKYLKKMSGADIPVVSDSAEESENEIIIGNTDRDVYSGVDFAELGEEGFCLKAVGKKLLIAGGSERGVIYGVYTFLEEQLGCRWYTNDYEYIPENDTISFSADLNDVQVPDFDIRRVNYGWITDPDKSVSFLYKSRTNVMFYNNYEEFGSGNDYVLWDVTMNRLVPDSLFNEDETLFAYNEETGKRTTEHVCMTNPDCLEYAIKNAEKYIDENETHANHIHIGQKDNSVYCQCENCKKLYEKYGSVSAPTIIFANELSDALKKDGYNICVTFYAYGETTLPPADESLKCNDGVIPVVCGTFYSCHCHPFTECGYKDDNTLNDSIIYRFSEHDDTKFSDELTGWTNIAKRVYIYDYSINFINDQLFLSNLQTLQPNTKFFLDNGVTGYTYTCGSDKTTPFCELRNYLYSKVMWNANSDIEYYIDDFLNDYYGDAAPMIKEYLNYITAKISKSGHATNTDWSYQTAIFTFDSFYVDRIWKKALNQNLTDGQRERAEMLELSWRYTEAVSMAGRYCLFNPLRAKEQEKLYDDLQSHGITKLSSLSGGVMPPKDSINFYFSTPQDWK